MPYNNLLVLLLASSLIFGCSSSKSTEPKQIDETEDSGTVSLDTPEADLLETAKRYYYGGLYSLAKENFDALRHGYPLSPFREFAELKSGDCLFEIGEYTEAAKLYEEFAKAHPSSTSLDYAQFRAADSYKRSHTGVGRDSLPLQKSLELLNQFVNRHPTSPYLQSARELRAEIAGLLSAHDKKIQRFYEKQENLLAVSAREKAYETKWVPVLKSVAFVPPKNQEIHRGVPEGASVTAAGSLKAEKIDSLSAMAVPQEDSSAARILKIECQTGNVKQLFVHLSSLDSVAQYHKGATLSGNNEVQVALANIKAAGQNSDCFGTGDLQISEKGTLVLKGASEATVMTLNNPSRLLVSIVR